jgi:hypothetical protein
MILLFVVVFLRIDQKIITFTPIGMFLRPVLRPTLLKRNRFIPLSDSIDRNEIAVDTAFSNAFRSKCHAK